MKAGLSFSAVDQQLFCLSRFLAWGGKREATGLILLLEIVLYLLFTSLLDKEKEEMVIHIKADALC